MDWLHIRQISSKLHPLFMTVSGAFYCLIAAVVVSATFARVPGRSLVPLLFVILIAAAAAYFGVAAGILGTIAAALVFAVRLYPPIGSINVQAPGARAELAWMILGGVSFSYLLGAQPREGKADGTGTSHEPPAERNG